MKKNILSIFTLICVLSLSACNASTQNDNKESNPKTEQTQNIPPQKTPKYTVSKEEWASALKFETPVTRAAQHVYYPENLTSDSFIYYDVIEYGDNIIYTYETDETKTQIIYEYYYEKKDDSCVRYTRNGEGAWVSEDLPLTQYAYRFERINGWDGEYGMEECFSYEDFTYDQLEQVYKCETMTANMDGEDWTLYNIALKFIDGKLKSFYMEAEVNGYNCINTIFDYEKIEVKLPDIQEK